MVINFNEEEEAEERLQMISLVLLPTFGGNYHRMLKRRPQPRTCIATTALVPRLLVTMQLFALAPSFHHMCMVEVVNCLVVWWLVTDLIVVVVRSPPENDRILVVGSRE